MNIHFMSKQFSKGTGQIGNTNVKSRANSINVFCFPIYQRVLLSKNKASLLDKADKPKLEDEVTPEEQIKDSLVLEFLGLKDEYAESELLNTWSHFY